MFVSAMFNFQPSDYQYVFSNAPSAIFIESLKGEILEANDAACQLQKLPREKLVGMFVYELVPEAEREELMSQFHYIANLESHFFESYTYNKWGHRVPVEIRTQRIRLSGGQPALLFHVTDISEKKEHEKRSSLFQNLLNQSQDAMNIYDFETGKLLHFNAQSQEMLGYSDDEMLALNMNSISPDMGKWSEMQHRFLTEEKSSYRTFYYTKKKEKLPIELTIKYIEIDSHSYFVSQARDISKQILQEKALKDSEWQYKSLVENMREGLICVDKDATILFANKAYCEIIEMEKLEILGKNFYELPLDKEYLSLVKSQTYLRKKGISTQYDAKLHCSSGLVKSVRISGSPMTTPEGEIIGTVAIVLNITDLKEVESKLEDKEKELDSFIYRASHDLLGPIASMKGLAQLGVDEFNTLSEVRKYFEKMLQTANRLDTIVVDLVEVSETRHIDIPYEWIDVQDLINRVLSQLQFSPRKEKMKFYLEIDIDSYFYASRGLLFSILKHLILNAILFKDREKAQSYLKISVEYSEKMNEICFCVEDNGIGIPQKILKKVFDIFYRGNERSKGSGMGLYIVKSAIKRLNGTFTLNSIEGKGTTFCFCLPVVEGEMKH
ncbi:MAG: PAS domain S-box protein [Bacteroidia bacterium]